MIIKQYIFAAVRSDNLLRNAALLCAASDLAEIPHHF